MKSLIVNTLWFALIITLYGIGFHLAALSVAVTLWVLNALGFHSYNIGLKVLAEQIGKARIKRLLKEPTTVREAFASSLVKQMADHVEVR